MSQVGTITHYDDELNGVLVDDRHLEVSIPGTLEGEEIRYRIEHVSPHAPRAWGVCEALLKPSPERVPPTCPLSWPMSGPCPGCPLMHMSDKLQNRLKKQSVETALQRAGIAYVREIPFHPAPETLRYRNRTDLIVGECRGKLMLGAYRNRTHDFFPIRACPVLRTPLNPVLMHVQNVAQKHGVPAYKTYEQRTGSLRYVSLFANDQRQVLVDLVCKSAEGRVPPWLRSFANALRAFPAIRGVSFSLNDSPNNAIRVTPSTTFWGETRLPEHHRHITTLYSAAGFTQLNTDVAAQIYNAARDWVLSSPRIIWDLYCGAGAFGRTMHPKIALYGAEFSPSAIEAAKKISRTDDFQTTFQVVDLETSWPDWPTPDTLLLDPPRKGLSQNAIAQLRRMKVPTLVYMSCNPTSFAQNIGELSDLYVLTRVEAFDMMPQTRQIETLGMLILR